MAALSTNDKQTQHFMRMLWAIPLSILLHNIEEYPRIVGYARHHGITINRRQMGIAVALATILPVPITAAATARPHDRRRLRLALALPALMAVNAWTHLAQTLFFRDYSPGTITGVGLNIPLALYLYKQALRIGLLTPCEVRQAALFGAAMMAPAALILQIIGWCIDRALSRHSSSHIK